MILLEWIDHRWSIYHYTSRWLSISLL